jgi:hypothetical protein
MTMKKRTLRAAVILAAAFFLAPAQAQTVPCTGPTQGICTPTVPWTTTGAVSTTNPIPVNTQPSSIGVITGNANGTTGAVVGTLAGVVGKTTYICGFTVSGIGGTADPGPVTIAGVVGSSMTFQMSLNNASTASIMQQDFTPCIPASAVNTAITTTTTAAAGATAVSVVSWGYQQ